MSKRMRILTIALFVVLPLVLVGCEWGLSDAEADRAISVIEPKVDDFFQGLEEDDYLKFSSGFDSYMRESIPAADFAVFRRELDTHLGSYLSREVRRAVRSDEYYVVDYQARFKKEEEVLFGVAFHRAAPNTINHVWLESSQQQWAPEPPR